MLLFRIKIQDKFHLFVFGWWWCVALWREKNENITESARDRVRANDMYAHIYILYIISVCCVCTMNERKQSFSACYTL